MNCIERFNQLRTSIPANVKIVAVSKTKPASKIEELYQQAGHKIFGENKAQELITKHEILPLDIDWHFIGHLQTNKIKIISPFIGLIQSVDSLKLLAEINKEAIKCKRVIPCLLQFYIASEESKFGFSMDEASKMFDDERIQDFKNVSVQGVMGMATYTQNKNQIRSEFKILYNYFKTLKSNYFADDPEFCEISMGMTDDYQLAIDEGSTIVRIGSGIFGER